jgi:hypothetical protein
VGVVSGWGEGRVDGGGSVAEAEGTQQRNARWGVGGDGNGGGREGAGGDMEQGGDEVSPAHMKDVPSGACSYEAPAALQVRPAVRGPFIDPSQSPE